MVVTLTEAFSLRGYWRTLSDRQAWTPAMMMTALTTMARTGRRMKRSVKEVFMTGKARSGTGRSGIFRFGRKLRVGGELVVDHHGHARAQLENTTGDDRLVRLQAGYDRDKITPGLAEADELLAQ